VDQAAQLLSLLVGQQDVSLYHDGDAIGQE
jgi:hypothetical protein